MKFIPLATISLFLTACSSIPTTNYKDNSQLETPPGYSVTKTEPGKPLEKQQEKKGLGDLVTMDSNAAQATLIINKTFNRAWFLVAKALKLNDLKITDRNRHKGFFFVDYDPDTATGDATDFFTFHIFKDEYEESNYKLMLVEKDKKINVSSMIKPPKSDSSLFEDEEDREQPKDGSSLLIKILFETIRDDLPGDL
jgi:hypothetical protein